MPVNFASLWAKQLALLQAVRARIRAAHPDHHAIARGMFWVSIFVVLGGIARAAKEMAIAWRYGVSAEVDAYLFVFNLITWPVGVWFGVLAVVLVPLAASIKQRASAELPRFRAELLGFALILAAGLGVVIWAGLPLLLRSSWTGLPATTTIIATDIAPWLSLLAPLGVTISLLSAWMLAAGRHANTLLESIPALSILAALFLLPTGGVGPLVSGTLAGFAFHAVILFFFLVIRKQVSAPRFTFASPHWPVFWQGFGIMLAGQALMSFTGIVDQFFAARLGPGAIATLSYANRVLTLIVGVGAMAVSRATLPVFSRSQAQGGQAVFSAAIYWATMLFLLGTFTMAIAWWLAPFGVRLLFERGAFTAQETGLVVEIFRYGLTQLPFYFAGIVLVSLLSSLGRYGVIAAVAGVNLAVKFLALVVLTPLMGITGVMFSNTIMYAATLALLLLVVRVR